ncbi:hypothetical protein DdX_15121 [Ditylenchus destructor]|uniref:Uncharacterized protein n=1 Tax=Ditylenchus destructor TaxID=166010 RepID=A0AAD4QV17_9BILA|nr:hypothetical protein DdX_15121 [Ditylenchus destructor]
MKSLFFLTILLVAVLGMSYGFTYFSHHRRSNSNSDEHGQQAHRVRGHRNYTGRPPGSLPTGPSPSTGSANQRVPVNMISSTPSSIR